MAKAAKPKARAGRAAKPKGRRSPPARQATVSTAAKPPRRGKDFRYEACPICGSRQLDVRKRDGLLKGAAKLAAGAAYIPVVIDVHDRYACRVCAWRSEATY